MKILKRVVSACIERIFEFDSGIEATRYLEKLEKAEKVFVVVHDVDTKDGKRQIRIKEQYNKSPLLND